jgi:hypothetical protein
VAQNIDRFRTFPRLAGGESPARLLAVGRKEEVEWPWVRRGGGAVMGAVCLPQYGSHELHVATEHLKCRLSDEGSDVLSSVLC